MLRRLGHRRRSWPRSFDRLIVAVDARIVGRAAAYVSDPDAHAIAGNAAIGDADEDIAEVVHRRVKSNYD